MTYSFAFIIAALAASIGTARTHSSLHAKALAAWQPSCSNHPATTENLAAQLAKFRPVRMPFSTRGLSTREVRMVRKLVDAGQYLESAFWRESDPEGLRLYQALTNCGGTVEKQIDHYLLINGSRYDLLEGNKPFLAGARYEPGHALYPAGITRKEIEDYVAAHPAKKAEIYNPWTVVKRSGNDLVGIPYHVEFKQWLVPAAQALRDAAGLSDDEAFANFLRLRADALLTDDYYKSDLAWVDLDNPKFDVIMAPYETYLDDLLGVKTSYGTAVMIRNPGESVKLATYKKYVADIQNALPIAAADRPSNAGHQTPMEVMDTPYRSGDLRHGYQAVADNLPNDPRIHAEKGTKKIFFKNFMDARVNYVVLPIGKLLMREDQAGLASMDGYLSAVVMHEIAHGLGPAYSRIHGKQADIRESIGPIYSGLEEAKADIVGLYGLDWLMNKGVLPKSRARGYYASHLAGIFRTVRFGVSEAHSKAEMMEFNYFAEQGAITRDARTGRYAIDFAKMPGAVASLAKELLEIEATGGRDRAESWFNKYGTMPAELKAALDKTASVPVDIDPITSFGENVR
ncbi:MAG: Zn-dependent hydrolase [Gemmatimonadota bacterium]|nr:Zn-dependent hydrolase [Gemmatimonadota bacterium]